MAEWRYSSTILNLPQELHILSYLRTKFHGRVGSTAGSYSEEAGFKYRPQRPLNPNEIFRSLRYFYQEIPGLNLKLDHDRFLSHPF
jgi:hypothetical protein